MGKKVYEEINAKQLMNRVKDPRMPFYWSINPYRGCSHGCSFCYARSTHSFLGMGADDTFQNHIFLKTNAAEALENQLIRLKKKHKGDLQAVAREVGLVAIGTATDPYQPVEGKEKLTRQCLQVLAAYRIPTTITTRSPLILRDIDILRSMHIESINISVNTLDIDVYRRTEPATPFPYKRLETVQALREQGLPAGVFIAPILPYLTDGAEQLEELAAALQSHRAPYAIPSVLRLKPTVKEWYFHLLDEQYPHLLPLYRKLYKGAYAQKEYAQSLLVYIKGLLQERDIATEIVVEPHIPDSVRLFDTLSQSFCSAGEPIAEQLSFF